MPVPHVQKANYVEFEIAKPAVSQNEKTRQVVHDAFVPEKFKVEKTDDRIKFLAEKAQRVKEQTKAAISGLTKNQVTAQSKNETANQIKNEKVDPFSTNYKPKIKPQVNNSGTSFSTVSESLEDIRVGSMTALNTDQYIYSSFFNRVNDLVYFPWSSMVRNSQERVAQRLYNKTTLTRWVTQIEIWIKPNGEFHSTHLMKESGIPEFDRSAVLAFQQAGLFPNPPKEMVEEDGLIHLKYSLTVYFDPKVLVSR